MMSADLDDDFFFLSMFWPKSRSGFNEEEKVCVPKLFQLRATVLENKMHVEKNSSNIKTSCFSLQHCHI